MYFGRDKKNAEYDPIMNAFEKILQGLKNCFAFFTSLKDFLRQLIQWSRQETMKHSPHLFMQIIHVLVTKELFSLTWISLVIIY